MTTYEQTQRRQAIRVLAGAAFAATLLALAPLRVSYGERQFCKANTLRPSAAFLQASEYLPAAHPVSPYGTWYGPTGARYGYATAEDSPIYPTTTTLERCN